MNRNLRNIGLLLFTCVLLLLTSCNTSKNTASVRFWKGFKAKYNTYYNGHQAYLEGMRTKRDNNKDNYLEPLPLLIVGNENSRTIGSGNFETAITKCEKAIQLYSINKKPVFPRGHKLTAKEKAMKNQTEFNPFLKNAWILMGMAQLQKGSFVDAAATFAYTARIYKTQPEIREVARALQALSYVEMEWYYDAEDLLDKVRRSGVPKESRRYYNMALADLHLHRKNWKEALPYVEKEVKEMKRGKERARGYFLLAQIYKMLDMKKQSYKALSKCMRQNPPYETKFNAQISQTEVLEKGGNKHKLSRLKSMARKTNNKNYLDQIYYAIGNIQLALPDTAKAIQTYEAGRYKTSGTSYAKSMLLIALGDIYYKQERFLRAHDCYKAAISGVRYGYERYEEINFKAKMLGKLGPYSEEIFLQDSLQALTRMSEKDRNEAIDRMIELEKKRQKEIERQRRDSIAQARANTRGRGTTEPTPQVTAISSDDEAMWYFYEEQSVSQGIELFRKQWGKRTNTDNWRFSNIAEALSKEAQARADSLMNARKDSIKQSKKARKEKQSENDPDNKLSREYYLAQLPFTPEKLQESNKKLEEALYYAGIYEMDDLEEYAIAKKTLTRLYNDFPNFQPKDYLLYKMYMMEMRWGEPAEAEKYRSELLASFPNSSYTEIIRDPNFFTKARYGKQIEDSLYAEAYEAFRKNDFETLNRNCEKSDAEYRDGANRSKFIFLEAMSALHDGNMQTFTIRLDSVSRYKDDPIGEIANKILEGIKSGRKPIGGQYNMKDFWESRKMLFDNGDEASKADTLNDNRLEPFTFILTFSPDSVEEGKLLYNISKFNFTTFAIRNFNVSVAHADTIHQIIIEGFANFDEVHRYAMELYQDSASKTMLKHTDPVIISDHNLKLVNERYTLQEYQIFYNQHFVPIHVRKDLDLDIDPGKFIWDEFEEVKPKETEKTDDDEIEIIDDSSEWY